MELYLRVPLSMLLIKSDENPKQIYLVSSAVLTVNSPLSTSIITF